MKPWNYNTNSFIVKIKDFWKETKWQKQNSSSSMWSYCNSHFIKDSLVFLVKFLIEESSVVVDWRERCIKNSNLSEVSPWKHNFVLPYRDEFFRDEFKLGSMVSFK